MTREELKSVLAYDPETGEWTWLVNTNPRARQGDKAGCIRPDNRRQIRFRGKFYLASRLAWFYMTGGWPLEIDHIDRNSLNDRWVNLREVTRHENLRNNEYRANLRKLAVSQ